MLRRGEIEQFIELGYVRIDEAIPREVADQCRMLAQDQLELSSEPPWQQPVVRGAVDGDATHRAAIAPRLVAAVGELLEGERWEHRPNLGLFVVRFPSHDDPGDAGWHIDASFKGPDTDSIFSYYVNYHSQGRGLLLLCLLSDVDEDDAPTRILERSHHAIPRLLRPFGPEGVPGVAVPLPDASGSVALATGLAGDVFLCHPFLVHAASWPHRGTQPRFIAQPPIGLSGPLRLERGDGPLSPVARPVVEALKGS